MARFDGKPLTHLGRVAEPHAETALIGSGGNRLGGDLRRQRTLECVEGLESANANLMGQVTLAWDDEQTSREAIVERLAKSGFPELAAV